MFVKRALCTIIDAQKKTERNYIEILTKKIPGCQYRVGGFLCTFLYFANPPEQGFSHSS